MLVNDRLALKGNNANPVQDYLRRSALTFNISFRLCSHLSLNGYGVNCSCPCFCLSAKCQYNYAVNWI